MVRDQDGCTDLGKHLMVVVVVGVVAAAVVAAVQDTAAPRKVKRTRLK